MEHCSVASVALVGSAATVRSDGGGGDGEAASGCGWTATMAARVSNREACDIDPEEGVCMCLGVCFEWYVE